MEIETEIIEHMDEYFSDFLNGEWEKIPGKIAYEMGLTYEHLPLLQWLRDPTKKGGVTPWDVHVVLHAGAIGSIKMLEWIFSQNPHPTGTSHLAGAVAANGHLHVLEWMDKKGCFWFEPHHMARAIENDHLEAVKWFRSPDVGKHCGVPGPKVTPWPRRLMNQKSLSKRMQEYLQEAGCPKFEPVGIPIQGQMPPNSRVVAPATMSVHQLMERAARRGDWETVRKYRQEGIEYNHWVFWDACAENQLDIVIDFMQNRDIKGIVRSTAEQAIGWARKGDCVDIVEYLKEIAVAEYRESLEKSPCTKRKKSTVSPFM